MLIGRFPKIELPQSVLTIIPPVPTLGNSSSTSSLPSWRKLLGHLPTGAALPLLLGSGRKFFDPDMIFSSVMSDVLSDGPKFKVDQSVICLVAISMMDTITFWDWPAFSFPYSAVFKLESPIGMSFGPARQRPAQHPVTSLLIAPWLICPFSLIICPTCLRAEHPLFACAKCFTMFSAGQTDES